MQQVALGIIVKDGQVIFLERKDGRRTFPGGKNEPNEPLEKSCKREVEEETGMEVEAVKLLYVKIKDNNQLHYFICKHIDGEPHIIEADKFNKVGWEPIEDICDLPDDHIAPEIKQYLRQHLEDPEMPAPRTPAPF